MISKPDLPDFFSQNLEGFRNLRGLKLFKRGLGSNNQKALLLLYSAFRMDQNLQ